MAPVSTVVECARHPDVQTGLRCSRCETPICPRCMIQTPIGARCPGCARLTKSPVYTLTPTTLVRAGLAAVIGGAVMGFIWWLILLPFTVGFFSIFIGAGLGYGFARMMEFATGRKRGPAVAAFAMGGIALAWAMQPLLLGVSFDFARYGLVAVGIGMYLAYQNLK